MASSPRSWILLPLALAVGLGLGAATANGRAGQTGALISTPGPIALKTWQANTDDLIPVNGRVTIDGAPVAGVLLRVGDFELPATGTDGRFTYLADGTRLSRYVVSVADDSQAKLRGAVLSSAQQKDLGSQTAAITIAYPVSKLRLGKDAKGDPTIAGQLSFSDGHTAPPAVGLYSYQLSGTVTDSSGHPVANALVSTRTPDRDYWTVSSPSDSSGHFSSLFTASDESGDNPVPLTVKVAIGNIVYQYLSFEFVRFAALQSALLTIRLPPTGYATALPLPRSYPGAIYQGILVGVSDAQSSAVRPLAATWPDRAGRFTLTLPHSFAGKTVSLWEAQLQIFSVAPATPGGPVAVSGWPASLPLDAALGVTSVHLS